MGREGREGMGWAGSEARDDAFTAGCEAFLLKPCAPDVVYLQVRALMRLRGDPLPV